MTDPEASFEPPDDIPAVSAERLVHGEEDGPEPAAGARRYPSTLGGLFYLLVLTLTLVGLVVVGTGHWRTGTRFLGGALLFAAGIRVVLRPTDAGMLGVRHKLVDAFLLIVVGGLLLFLAASIPDQPA